MMTKRLLMGLAVGTMLMAMLPGVASAKAGDTSVCKDGGWTGLVRADGTAFKNQGDCVSYIAKGGTLGAPGGQTTIFDSFTTVTGVAPQEQIVTGASPSQPTTNVFVLEASDGVDSAFIDVDVFPEGGTIFAIAYSNLDGTSGFGAGDVLISRLVDGGDLDGILNAGDLIIMGQYPTNTSASDFASWGVTSHTVQDVLVYQTGVFAGVYLTASDGSDFTWQDNTNPQSGPNGYGELFFELR